jgi:hypothetical protein
MSRANVWGFASKIERAQKSGKSKIFAYKNRKKNLENQLLLFILNYINNKIISKKFKKSKLYTYILINNSNYINYS